MARRKGESRSESSISDIFIALRRADRALTHLYDLGLAPTGLKATQVAILQAIQQSDEIAQWRLAANFGISDASISRRLSTLRTAGLVAMRISGSHPKERLYQLTARGACQSFIASQRQEGWTAASNSVRRRRILGRKHGATGAYAIVGRG
jgi:DNA-binding transcriptional ArsR family regulator